MASERELLPRIAPAIRLESWKILHDAAVTGRMDGAVEVARRMESEAYVSRCLSTRLENVEAWVVGDKTYLGSYDIAELANEHYARQISALAACLKLGFASVRDADASGPHSAWKTKFEEADLKLKKVLETDEYVGPTMYKCKCGSTRLQTNSVQRRAVDEPADLDFSCRACGASWTERP